MVFDYQGMKDDGKIVRGSVRASSLQEARKNCGDHGIIIQSITASRQRKVWAGVLSSLAVLLVIAVIWISGARTEKSPRTQPQQKKQAEEKVEKSPPAKMRKIFSGSNGALREPRKVDPPKVRRERFSSHYDIARVAAALPMKPGIRRYRNTDELLADTNAVYQAPPLETTLRSDVERNLKLIAGIDPRSAIPPMPPGAYASLTENDFLIAATNVIVIWDEDDERAAREKTRIAELKEQMLALVNSGCSVGEAFDQLYREHNLRADLYRGRRREYIRLLAEGKEQEADSFVKEANRELKKCGAPEIEGDE